MMKDCTHVYEKNGVDVVSVFFKSKVHMCPNICVHFN